jgi:D-glycero-alpha-D-manno-heptose-7-phosphate kinase
MIIVRSPLRISLGGGGTDLPSYYRDHGGFLISAAIDKYVYVTVSRPFAKGFFLKYSDMETVGRIAEIKHSIIRESLLATNFDGNQIEIASMADIPAGTGLGSSGSFTVALLKALHAFSRRHINQDKLAELACHVEIDRLSEPVGKQDQYISAIGGVTCFAFHKDDSVSAAPLNVSQNTLTKLEDSLLLFFTGFSRSASGILKDQHVKSQQNDISMIENLHFVKNLGYRIKTSLETGDVEIFGDLMNEHWEHKKKRSTGMTNSVIDDWYKTAIKNGAIGGKIVGAGGGGFLMFMARDPEKLRNKMCEIGLEEVRFRFDFEGAKVVFS